MFLFQCFYRCMCVRFMIPKHSCVNCLATNNGKLAFIYYIYISVLPASLLPTGWSPLPARLLLVLEPFPASGGLAGSLSISSTMRCIASYFEHIPCSSSPTFLSCRVVATEVPTLLPDLLPSQLPSLTYTLF